MRTTHYLLLMFFGCTLSAASVRGQSEALSICRPMRTAADAPCAFIPSVISAEFPTFSERAVEATREGSVALSVTISQAGIPEDIQVVKSAGKEFDQEAIAAFRQSRFKPTIYKSEPTAVRGTATLRFKCHTFWGLMATPDVSDYTPAEGRGAKRWKGSLPSCGRDFTLRGDPNWMKNRTCAPELINRVPIEATGDSKQVETWGAVVLSFKIRENGTVEDVRVIKPADEELNRLALANAQQSGLRFVPGFYKGRPMAVRAKAEVRFWTCRSPSQYWELGP